MKVSIITAVWNGAKTIGTALESVARQRTEAKVEGVGVGGGVGEGGQRIEIEHIVVDGGSTDGTVEVIKEFETLHSTPTPTNYTFRWLSEKDRGLYDAINKGIKMATGDVVGICNADDALAEDDTVAKIAAAFESDGLDATWADIRFVKGEKGPLSASASSLDLLRKAKTARYCTGRFFRRWMFRFGTFPAHPSTFVRKACFEKYGHYSLDYKICADFELMLRLFWKHGVRAKYLPICTHVMRTGGLSTAGFRSNRQINAEDLRALRANGYWSCLALIYTKYFFKIWGFVFRRNGKGSGLRLRHGRCACDRRVDAPSA